MRTEVLPQPGCTLTAPEFPVTPSEQVLPGDDLHIARLVLDGNECRAVPPECCVATGPFDNRHPTGKRVIRWRSGVTP